MTTIIDKSATVSMLDVGTLSTTVIQHDAGSPHGRVVVNAGAVNVGHCAHLTLEGATLVTNSVNERIDLTIIVDNGSVLDVKGAVQASSRLCQLSSLLGATSWAVDPPVQAASRIQSRWLSGADGESAVPRRERAGTCVIES